jgi:PQQ-dependent dehydrogenase (methanol/ethanol family)
MHSSFRALFSPWKVSLLKISLIAGLLLGASGCSQVDNHAAAKTVQPATPARVDTARLLAADSEPGNWMSHGRTYDEQRFSPLTQIDAANVSRLGLDWSFDFPTNRGIEATPIVVDGVMYVTSSWSMVFALDAKSGKLLWHYDPEVPKQWSVNACCDAVNRGVAAWNGRIYVGTLDGRLIALDAKTGKPAWSVQTTPQDKPYTITGAPRIVKGKVLIGNGGAELGVRGYISAYDADTGAMAWRFYTVPGDPAKPFENPALAMAAKTWKGTNYVEIGGGGTVWDSMAYDAELDLLYIGVGNGSPWDQTIRSPGGGDNLFLSSIVALRPGTGEYVWHYQTTPGEVWDYTATQHIILADVKIDGAPRKVLMQAPKNGFFYVLDRVTGKLLSAQPYTKVTWASRVDLETGRPVETVNARYSAGKASEIVFPHPLGGHNWMPMSYSPQTGLVYIPAQEAPLIYAQQEGFKYNAKGWNTGADLAKLGLPDDKAVRQELGKIVRGFLTAWDPVAQKEAWRVPHSNFWNGGVLSTGGNLVFQGNSDGEFVAYRADNGQRLWSADSQTGIVAAPISYAVDGEQYVAIAAGWGGGYALNAGELATRSKGAVNRSRVLVYKLGGAKQLPAPVEVKRELPQPPPLTADAATVTQGHTAFMRNCMVCHGDRAVSGSSLPDLRYMSAATHEQFDAIVLGGIYWQKGMVGFGDKITKSEADAIHHYLIKRSHDLVDGRE